MRKAGVIGWPVAHSLSPKLFRYWFKQHGIAGEYVALEVEPENLAETVKALVQKGFCGINVTVPHKETIKPLLHTLDDKARAVGAVNTVIISGEKLKGTNTDAHGFIENLRQNGYPQQKNKAVILGAGGAAKAVVKALLDDGFKHILVANRTRAKTEAMSEHFGGLLDVVPWEHRAEALADADLLVNATKLGLKGGDPLQIDLAQLPQTAVVTDLVYAPLVTPLLAEAKARGNVTVDGLGMLIHQAVPAFEAWFGVRPAVDEHIKKHLLHE